LTTTSICENLLWKVVALFSGAFNITMPRGGGKGKKQAGGRKQEAEAGSLFMVLETGMEARSWMLEAGKYGLFV
jgi:hypothetical protein